MKNWTRYLLLFAGLALLGALASYFSDIVTYVIMAWVISLLGAPPMRLLERVRIGRWQLSRPLSAALVLVLFFGLLLAVVALFVPLVLRQAQNFAAVDLDAVLVALQEPINQLQAALSKRGIAWQGPSVEEQLRHAMSDSFDGGVLAAWLSSIVGLAGNLLIGISSVAFMAFFFLKDQNLFSNFLQALVPSAYEEKVLKAIHDISALLTRYFGGIVLQVSIITIVVSTGLSILGVDNALLIGFFAGLINVIPYVGPIIGAAFGCLVALSSNLDLDFYAETLPLLGKVVLVFSGAQMLDNFVLQPFIFSNSVKAHPLEIFIIILAGAKLGGIGGMVLAIPAYTVLRVVASTFFSEFHIVQKLTRGMQREGDQSPP